MLELIYFLGLLLLLLGALSIKNLKRTLVDQYELAFLYKNDKLVDVKDIGQYWFSTFTKVIIIDLNVPFQPIENVSYLLSFPAVAKYLKKVVVQDGEIGLEYVDGLFHQVLDQGRYVYWDALIEYKIDIIDVTKPIVSEEFPSLILSHRLLAKYIDVFTVDKSEKGLLFIQGEFIKVLNPGRYFFWKTNKLVSVVKSDMRSQQLEITGQEILTKDKAAIRVNFDVQYKVVSLQKALVETKDLIRQMYTTIQFSIRECLGTMTLDEILSRKQDVAPFVLKETKDRLTSMGIDLLSAGMRDIILPGEVKEIIGQVLVARKKAQANNIMRQEETASTRSLLNTAKLMEQNEMLFRLKEMEYVEKIAEKVGEITVNGSDKVIGQLKNIFSSNQN